MSIAKLEFLGFIKTFMISLSNLAVLRLIVLSVEVGGPRISLNVTSKEGMHAGMVGNNEIENLYVPPLSHTHTLQFIKAFQIILS